MLPFNLPAVAPSSQNNGMKGYVNLFMQNNYFSYLTHYHTVMLTHDRFISFICFL